MATSYRSGAEIKQTGSVIGYTLLMLLVKVLRNWVTCLVCICHHSKRLLNYLLVWHDFQHILYIDSSMW